MRIVCLTLIALASATSWHRKAVGIPLDAAFIPQSNQTVLVSDEFVSRINEDGEILWRQIHTSKAPQIEVGEFAYVLDSGVLTAFNVSNGAKEWTYPGVNSFAPHPNGSVIIESFGQYCALKPTFAAGQYAVGHSQWIKIPDVYNHEIYACHIPLMKSGDRFFYPNNTETQCYKRKPDLEIENGTVSLKDKWSLHEGLSNGEAACILSRMHIAEHDQGESWRVRTARHSAFKWLGAPPEEHLVVVGTRFGSLYGLDAKSGDVNWIRHGDFPPGAKLSGEKNLLVVETPEKISIFSFDGKCVSSMGASLTADTEMHAQHGYRYETVGNALHGYNNSQHTWEYRPENMTIRAVSHRGNISTSSIAKRVGPSDYLYRYLNPNLLAVINENATEFELVLLDAISGRRLGSVMHSKVGTVSESLEGHSPECTIGDHWVACCLGAQLYVLELFETSSLNTRRSHSTQSSMTDTLVPYFVEYKHDLPHQQVTKLAAINTRQGTGSGLLICADYSVAFLPQWKFLSQRYAGMDTALESLSKHAPVHGMITLVAATATRYDSTAAVTVLGRDIFFTFVEPSGAFDKLPAHFSYSGVLCSLFILIYLAYQLSMSHMQAVSQLAWS